MNKTNLKFYQTLAPGPAVSSLEQIQRLGILLMIESISLEWEGEMLVKEGSKCSISSLALQQLFLQDDSKDLKVVAGNGAEFLCHSLIFKGLREKHKFGFRFKLTKLPISFFFAKIQPTAPSSWQ